MGDDEKKISDNCTVDSSSLLTDWLFKYKLDNISYISIPQSLLHTHSKTARRGGIFDSRDIIRPTVQLFKNVKSRNRKRNDTPSPQRGSKPKLCTTQSPSKEINRIFNHKGTCEDVLESYRKIYTYGRVKQDKVSRDKIESAVALYRQREQGKENSTNKPAPEKSKKVDNKEETGIIDKSKKKGKIIKPTTNENMTKNEGPSEANEKQLKHHEDVSKSSSKEREKDVQSRGSKHSGEVKNKTNNKSKKNIKPNNKNGMQLKKSADKLDETSNSNLNDHSANEEENKVVNINIEDKTELKSEKESHSSSKGVKIINNLKSDSNTERNHINVLHFNKKLTNEFQIESQTRASLIKSLKAKHSRKELIKNSPDLLINRKLAPTDYMIVKPAFISKEVINVAATTRPKGKKSVEDLLREYRIKYRNMMKLR